MYTINLNYNIISHLTNYIYIEGIRTIRASSPAKPQPCTYVHLCRGHYQPPEPDLHRLLLLLRAKKNYLINWKVAGSGTELIIFFCHSNRRQTHHRLYINKHCYRIRIRILDIVTVLFMLFKMLSKDCGTLFKHWPVSEHTKIPFLSFFYWGEWRTKRIKIAQNG